MVVLHTRYLKKEDETEEVGGEALVERWAEHGGFRLGCTPQTI